MCQTLKSTSQKAKTKCVTKYCRRERAKGRYCTQCETENKKAKNPYRYWYNVNKANANRRAREFNTGKFWFVTFDYWVQFCDESGYLILKGKGRDDMTLDCIENDKGYVDGNLQILTNEANARKGKKKVVYNQLTGGWDVVIFTPPAPETDLPF